MSNDFIGEVIVWNLLIGGSPPFILEIIISIFDRKNQDKRRGNKMEPLSKGDIAKIIVIIMAVSAAMWIVRIIEVIWFIMVFIVVFSVKYFA